jgi:threonyl-tRNA synthetase
MICFNSGATELLCSDQMIRFETNQRFVYTSINCPHCAQFIKKTVESYPDLVLVFKENNMNKIKRYLKKNRLSQLRHCLSNQDFESKLSSLKTPQLL